MQSSIQNVAQKNKRCVDTSALSHTRSVKATKAKNYT